MAKVISLFNHKGGVSKTTTVFHLAWKMASLGKRVLIVDADPQCNLTGLALGLEDYDSLFSFYDSKQNTDIFNSLAPIFQLESNVPSQSLGRIAAAETGNQNMFILAGNIRFSEIDIQLATALTSSKSLPILKHLVSSINRLIREIAKRNEIDVVFIDMSPSVSATNHCLLMGSDYFIIPISADFYCYQAIDSLSNVLPKWSEEITDFRRGNDNYVLPSKNPKMLGFISQNYRIYTPDQKNENSDIKAQKKMAKAYQDWINRIKDIVAKKLVPSLQGIDMIISEDLFKKCVSYDKPYHLAGIQNFNTLIPVSQRKSKPIYELTQEDGGWSGAVWERKENNKDAGAKFSIREADNVYQQLSQSVLEMAYITV